MPKGNGTPAPTKVNGNPQPSAVERGTDRALWAFQPSDLDLYDVAPSYVHQDAEELGADATRMRSRRGHRYLARHRSRHFTQNKRLAGCGRWLNGSADGRVIVKMAEGVAHYSGLQSCGSVWSCPACSAKIRQARAQELEEAIATWLAGGGGVEFVTFTIPHGEQDSLQATFDLVADGWAKGIVSGGFRGDRIAWGIPAWVRTLEVTLGQHGWHPHVHALLFTRKPWTPRQRAMRGEVLFRRWARFIERTTGRVCSRAAFRIVGGALGAGRYITKVQESEAWRLGMEFTRGDLKTGRIQSLTPFELIAPASSGEAWALCRWWEWEQVTKGRRCMSWSRGGRELLGLDAEEPTDQELADAEVGGEEIASIPGDVWAQVAQKPGADAGLLAAFELGGTAEGWAYLAWLRRPAPPP